MKPICFYHKADLDGVCSGAIVKHFVPDVELYGFNYGEEFPWRLFENTSAEPGFEDAHAEEEREKRTVYMVDVSLPTEEMKRLAEVSNLIWIDHHKTAIDAYDAPKGGNTWLPHSILLQTDWSACELCWYWFTGADLDDPNKPIPEAVRLLGRYDVWDTKNPEWESKILPFQYGMRRQGKDTYDPSSIFWSGVVSPGIWSVKDVQVRIEWGLMILDYQAEVNRRAMETGAYEVRLLSPRGQTLLAERKSELEKLGPCPENRDAQLGWLGWVAPIEYDIKWLEAKTPEVFRDRGVEPYVLRVLACNTIVFNSQFFDGFYDPQKHDVMCAYCQIALPYKNNGDEKEWSKELKWKVSLYSTKPEIDCGAICKAFGGGGHKGAAGFICDKLPWETKS